MCAWDTETISQSGIQQGQTSSVWKHLSGESLNPRNQDLNLVQDFCKVDKV